MVAPDTADDQAAVARKGSAARQAAYADRIETEIKYLIDHDAWSRAIEVEAAETESMLSFFSHWPTFSRQAGK